MNKTIRLLAGIAAIAAAFPATAAWEELRRNDHQRLSIDKGSIKAKGGETAFQYLVDFRETQGEAQSGLYRSAVVTAAIRCKDNTISVKETEVFPGNEAKGTSLGIRKSTADEAKWVPIEKGSSDVELYDRVCKGKLAPASKADAKTGKDAKK